MVIQFDNCLPERSKVADLLQRSGMAPGTDRNLVSWSMSPDSEPSGNAKFIAAYDSDLLVGIGRLGDQTPLPPSDPDEIVILPAYQNREIDVTISKLLHARSFAGRNRDQ